MSRTRTADKPGWLRVRVRCPDCGGGWFDWLPDGAGLRVLQVAAEDIECPACSQPGAAGLRETMEAMAEEDDDERRDMAGFGADDRPGRVAGGAA